MPETGDLRDSGDASAGGVFLSSEGWCPVWVAIEVSSLCCVTVLGLFLRGISERCRRLTTCELTRQGKVLRSGPVQS